MSSVLSNKTTNPISINMLLSNDYNNETSLYSATVEKSLTPVDTHAELDKLDSPITASTTPTTSLYSNEKYSLSHANDFEDNQETSFEDDPMLNTQQFIPPRNGDHARKFFTESQHMLRPLINTGMNNYGYNLTTVPIANNYVADANVLYNNNMMFNNMNLNNTGNINNNNNMLAYNGFVSNGFIPMQSNILDTNFNNGTFGEEQIDFHNDTLYNHDSGPSHIESDIESPYSSSSKGSKGGNLLSFRVKKQEKAVVRHKPKAHQSRYTCSECGKGFKRPSSLKTHSNIHTGFKPYECPHEDCCKSFNAKSNMLRHYKLHFKLTSGVYKLPNGEITLKKPTTKQLLYDQDVYSINQKNESLYF